MKIKKIEKTKQRLTGNGYAVWPFSVLRLPFTTTANRCCQLLLLLLLCPLVLTAQNGVTVSNLAVDAGTVTFNVSWKNVGNPEPWSDTVWVFVDYNKAGKMERLPLSAGATLTETSAPGFGKVIEVSGNNQGVWVVGNARSAGSFSATVQLLTATATATGICAYASNYPPVGEYTDADKVAFKGTPCYVVVLNNAAGVPDTVPDVTSPFTVPSGSYVQSFTDKTGAPGKIECVRPTVYTLTASAPGFCAGDAGVTFGLSDTETGVKYQLYNGTAAVGTVLTGNGSAATFSGTFNAGAYTARSVAEGVYCAVQMSGAPTISENPLPTAPTISSSGDVCQNGGNIEFTATGYTGTLEWVLIGGGAESGNTITFTSTSTGAKAVTARSAQTYTGAPTCYSAEVTQSAAVHTAPTAPASLSSTAPTICNGAAATLTATGGYAGSGAVYEWGTGSVVGSNPLSPATTTANTRTVSPSGASTYWVRLKGTTSCTATTGGVTTAIDIYPALVPGTILGASATTTVGVAPTYTAGNAVPASGGSGNLTYVWLRTGTSSATLTGAAATYAINSDASNYSTAGTYYFNRYVKDNTCNTTAAASGTYTLGVVLPGIDQPQGSCTYTPPAVVGTFASFPANYSASTYVSLTDERDSKNYPVVKIGGRWIMARNLNYQTGLTHQTNSNQPTTTSGGGVTALIGHFWCPGGYSSTSLTSTLASCNVWGALYSWETAMMVDGKWTSSAHSSSGWTEPTSYGTNTSSANTQNHARTDGGATTGGRGICPPNWHVPTDGEWGDILNSMETGTTNHNTSTGWNGTNAGSRGKSTCTVADNGTSGDTYVNDTQANWYYYSSNTGTDVYGFRVLPSGFRYYGGYGLYDRGSYAYYWSSSAYSSTQAWLRSFYYSMASVNRYEGYSRSYGLSVRCIRD